MKIIFLKSLRSIIYIANGNPKLSIGLWANYQLASQITAILNLILKWK